jgi:hypothetical protein
MLKRLFLLYCITLVCQLGLVSHAVMSDSLPSPVAGSVSSPFGWRVDPLTGKSRYHSGLDISAPHGTPVYAIQPGWVVFAGQYGGYGNLVVLEHAQGLHTWYAHNAVMTRQPGDWVNPGETIALVGATGRATGPHLHFEVRLQGQAIDPLQYLASLNISQQNLATSGPIPHSPHPVSRHQLAEAPAPRMPEVKPHWVGPTTKPTGGTALLGPTVEVVAGGKTAKYWFDASK